VATGGDGEFVDGNRILRNGKNKRPLAFQRGELRPSASQCENSIPLELCDAFLAGARSDYGSAVFIKTAPTHSLPGHYTEIARSLVRGAPYTRETQVHCT
jgi:hypothetical protein